MTLSLLLDISDLKSSSQFPQRFKETAESLFYDHCLRIEHKGAITDLELLEIEFYLQKGGHEDPFCHAHNEQEEFGQWYFHRAPGNTVSSSNNSNASTLTDAGGYRGGTRKGVDITFGAPVTSLFFPASRTTTKCRGGILLRSVRIKGGNGGIISGPSLLVDKILEITRSRNIAELIRTGLNGCLSAFPSSRNYSSLDAPTSRMYLFHCPRRLGAVLPTIHQSPRVGLDLSHPSASPRPDNPRVVYLPKLYRYFVRPELLRVNGRCHTLIGIFLEQAVSESDFVKGSFHADSTVVMCLMKMTTLKRTTVEKYLEDYVDGFKTGSLSEYVGSSGKGASSNPKKFMRMMGVLRRMELLTTDG